MRFAVCFSLPVETVPESSTVVSVTTTLTFEFASVGSFFKAASICFCKLLDSALAVAPVSLCGRPELCGNVEGWPSVAEVPVRPAVVVPVVAPVLPTPVEGAVAPVVDDVVPWVPVEGVVAPVVEEVVPWVLPLMLPAVVPVVVPAPADGAVEGVVLVPADGAGVGGVVLGPVAAPVDGVV